MHSFITNNPSVPLYIGISNTEEVVPKFGDMIYIAQGNLKKKRLLFWVIVHRLHPYLRI